MNNPISNLYQNTAIFYDGGNSLNHIDDVGFYRKMVEPGEKVLEIGCGTGRVAIELARIGVHVTGIDLSDSMLSIFKEKLKDEDARVNEKIRIEKADMTDFSIDDTFDLVIFPFRAFQSLTTNQQRVNCLNSVKKHLKKKGKVVIDMFNPDPDKLRNYDQRETTDFDYHDKNIKARVVRKSFGLSHDAEGKILKTKMVFQITEDTGRTSFIEDFLELGYLYKEDADVLFTQNGFQIEHLYSWWDYSPYNEKTRRELIYLLSLKQ